MSRYASLINETIPMRDVVERYLPEIKVVDSRIPCPFHHGKDRNMALYDNCYVCYVCHEKGSAVKFVATLFDIPYAQAEEKINQDFNLCLPIGNAKCSLGEQLAAINRLKVLAGKRRAEEIAKDARESHWLLMWTIWITANEMRLEALDTVERTGEYPSWADEAFRLWMWIDNEIKEGEYT